MSQLEDEVQHFSSTELLVEVQWNFLAQPTSISNLSLLSILLHFGLK